MSRIDGLALTAALQRAFPHLPTEPPEGATGSQSTYLHVAVCYGEFRSLERLMGSERAVQVIEEIHGERYRAVYDLVLRRLGDIETVVRSLMGVR